MLAGLMPFIAMIGAFLIGVAYETLPACNPFLDGCASISATGRKPPGSFLFRAIMLPYTVVLVFLWYYAVHWLRTLDTELTFGPKVSGLLSETMYGPPVRPPQPEGVTEVAWGSPRWHPRN